MENKTKKCIKGFDSELKCRYFQYEVGKFYKLPDGEHVEICKNGFHAIDEGENPLSVFDFYSPCGENGKPSRYCEVEVSGETQKDGEKIVGSEIKIVREIGFQGVIDAHRKWVKRHPEVGVSEENDDNSVASNIGNNSVASNTGDFSVASNTGNYSVASNTGECSVVSNTGVCSVASNTGDCSVVSNTGVCSVASNTGNRSVASNTGDYSVASNTGDYSVASNTGNYSVASNTGECSVASNTGVRSMVVNNGFYGSAIVSGKSGIAVAGGYNGKVKGSLGCVIMAVELGERKGRYYQILSCASAIVDGAKVKANTWYKCKNGKLVEC